MSDAIRVVLHGLEGIEKRLEVVERKLRDRTAPRVAIADALREIHESLTTIRVRAGREEDAPAS